MAENGSPKKTINLTESESALLIGIMKHLTSEIQFDADALAAEMGYKNGTVLKSRWSQIKTKKLGLGGTASPGGIKKKPAAKKGYKNASEEDDAEDGEANVGEDPASPTKRATKKGTKARAEVDSVIKEEESGHVAETVE